MIRGYRISASTGIHKGDRDYQQDQVTLLSHARVNGCVLAVVADGMGGRSGGRKASDQVMLTSRQLFERFDPENDDPAKLLLQIVQEAHMVIRLTAISSEQEPHSTIAAFLILPSGECRWAHAGDSRIYHFNQGEMLKRTRDHSYVQALVDRGEITEEEANEALRLIKNSDSFCWGCRNGYSIIAKMVYDLNKFLSLPLRSRFFSSVSAHIITC